jgi:hypothetical protein
MPFYLRKSISAGPFRFNFSKGGVGVSIGIKGLRFGTGPKGHYVHAGRNGVYYRATIDRAGAKQTQANDIDAPSSPSWVEASGVEMIDVESGNVLAMRDVVFGEVLDEINARRKQTKIATLLACGATIFGLAAALVIGPNGLLFILFALPAWSLGRWIDSYRRTTVIFYDMDHDTEQRYQEFIRCFDALSDCVGKWHIEAGGAVRDLTSWKRNAGATHLVQRKPTSLTYKLPSTINCNVTPPTVPVGKQTIYFLPDVALIEHGDLMGGVGYPDLHIRWQSSNFIEEDAVPSDATIIGHTWKHPNKSGGPDRRFRDNRQLPVCLYEVMHLTSASGLNELVEFSRTGMASPFVTALKSMPPNRSASRIFSENSTT